MTVEIALPARAAPARRRPGSAAIASGKQRRDAARFSLGELAEREIGHRPSAALMQCEEDRAGADRSIGGESALRHDIDLKGRAAGMGDQRRVKPQTAAPERAGTHAGSSSAARHRCHAAKSRQCERRRSRSTPTASADCGIRDLATPADSQPATCRSRAPGIRRRRDCALSNFAARPRPLTDVLDDQDRQQDRGRPQRRASHERHQRRQSQPSAGEAALGRPSSDDRRRSLAAKKGRRSKLMSAFADPVACNGRERRAKVLRRTRACRRASDARSAQHARCRMPASLARAFTVEIRRRGTRPMNAPHAGRSPMDHETYALWQR